MRAAAQKWRDNDNSIDDITCITIFLEVDNAIPKHEENPFETNKRHEQHLGTALINSSHHNSYKIGKTFVSH